MKKLFAACLTFLLVIGVLGGSVALAMTVPGTDFTRNFSHSYTTGAVFQYTVGGLWGNGWNESKQSVSTVETAYVAAQFTSLNGHVAPEVANYGSSSSGWVYSGRCYGQTKNAKKLMFYADVRRGGSIIDELRVYYE